MGKHAMAPKAEKVWFEGDTLVVALSSGEVVSAALSAWRRLEKATPEQRNHWRLIGGGEGINWPEVDEDLSTAGIIRAGRVRHRETATT